MSAVEDSAHTMRFFAAADYTTRLLVASVAVVVVAVSAVLDYSVAAAGSEEAAGVTIVRQLAAVRLVADRLVVVQVAAAGTARLRSVAVALVD